METPAWAQAIIVRPEQSYASGPTPAYRYGLPSCAHAYATAAAAPALGAGTLNGWPPMLDGPRPVSTVFRAAADNLWPNSPLAAVRHLLPPIPVPGPEDPGPFSWAEPGRVHRILERAGFRR